jgi:drug/metabolite transporter superfamily protein YnfA
MDLAIPVGLRQIFARTTTPKDVDPETEIPSFGQMLEDAEMLLSYAATVGSTFNDADVKALNDEIRQAAGEKSGDHDYTNAVLAYSRVAKQLLPVTAYTLRECFVSSKRIMRFYARWGGVFVIIVVLASLVTFVSSSISDSMKSEIDVANSKVIALRAHLGPPPGAGSSRQPANDVGQSTYSEQDKLIDLQQLAISTRSIYSRAQQLRLLMMPAVSDPFRDSKTEDLHKKFELDMNSTDYDNFVNITETFQDVRSYAQSLREGVMFWYGGLAASILPVCYALLGASAWSLRRMQIELRDRTFAGFGGKSAQLLVAAIAGTVISLFSGLFASTTLSLSPLAWAFLAGYSSDSLFHLLDGVLRVRARDEPTVQPVPVRAAGA